MLTEVSKMPKELHHEVAMFLMRSNDKFGLKTAINIQIWMPASGHMGVHKREYERSQAEILTLTTQDMKPHDRDCLHTESKRNIPMRLDILLAES